MTSSPLNSQVSLLHILCFMTQMAVFLIITLSICFALTRAGSLVHFDISQSPSQDEFTLDFKYKELMDLQANVKRVGGNFLFQAKSHALLSSLIGKLEMEPNGDDTLFIGIAEGSIVGVNVSYNLFAISNQCPGYQLWHSLETIPSDLVTFSSNVTGSCSHDNSLEQVIITIDLNGKLNPLLKTRLDQIFVFEGTRIWEEMKMKNAAFDIHVKADWPDEKRGYKRATFKSHLPEHILPSFVLEFIKNEQEEVFKVIKSLVGYEKDEL